MARIEGPDQPRSWAIALAAFVINFLLSGIGRTTGLFYVALIETYGLSRLQANLPFTVRNSVRNLAGPLVGALGQKYGPRDVTLLGGVFSVLGIILCTFAPNVIWITILWGGMHGLGVSLGNTLFSVVVTQYFLKHRATASGLALSGACVGSMVLPILLEYLLLNLGLSETFLVTGGIMLHALPASILMMEPPWIRDRSKQNFTAVTATLSNNVVKPFKEINLIQVESNRHTEDSKVGSVQNKKSVSSSVTCIREGLEQTEKLASSPTTFISGFNGVDNLAYVGSRTDLSAKIDHQAPEDMISEKLRRVSISGMKKTDHISSDEIQETSVYKSILKVCRDPMFHLISLSMASYALIFDPTITVIVDYLMDKGLKEDLAKYFISMLSLADLLGRLCFGWVTDKNYLSIPKFMMLLQVVNGVTFLFLPFCFGFDALMTVIVFYGMLSGATSVMFPILVGKYLQSVQSMAFGSITFLTGLLSFAVPPLIGYFRDTVGSYDGMFLITGGLSVATGLLWLLESLLVKLGERLKQEQSTSSLVVDT